NLGSVSSDPSTLINGDLWYNSTTNKFRGYENGAAVDIISAGGGITNTAANTELAKSDGTNLISSGVFIPSDGNINLGSASLAGSTRTIAAVGSSGSIGLNIQAKGSLPVLLGLNTSGDVRITNGANTSQFDFFTNNNLFRSSIPLATPFI